MNTSASAMPPRQSGFVLITGLVFLTMATLLACASAGQGLLQNRITANEYARIRVSLQANAALRTAEDRLRQQTTPAAVPVASTQSITAPKQTHTPDASYVIRLVDNCHASQQDTTACATDHARLYAIMARARWHSTATTVQSLFLKYFPPLTDTEKESRRIGWIRIE